MRHWGYFDGSSGGKPGFGRLAVISSWAEITVLRAVRTKSLNRQDAKIAKKEFVFFVAFASWRFKVN